MMIYVVTIDNVVMPQAYTALSYCCAQYGIPYYQAYRGKREFNLRDSKILLAEVVVFKAKRGRKM